MKNISILIAASIIMVGCATKEVAPKATITIPSNLKNGACEKKIPEIKGNTGKDLYIFADNALNKIEQCKIEKRALIRLIEESNRK